MEKYQRITFDATNGLMSSTGKELMKGALNLPIMAENTPGLALGYSQLVVGPAVNRAHLFFYDLDKKYHFKTKPAILKRMILD